MKHKIIVALLFVLWFKPLFSQPYCDVRQFNIRDGLAANIISGIAQTRDELMWFATWNGLCCYDGYRFTTFRDRMRGDEVLTTNRIRNIEANSNGDLWCCTFDSRLYLFDTHKNKYININKIIKNKFGIDFKVRRVYSLHNGYSWAVTDRNDGVNFRIDDKLAASGDGIELYSKILLSDKNKLKVLKSFVYADFKCFPNRGAYFFF